MPTTCNKPDTIVRDRADEAYDKIEYARLLLLGLDKIAADPAAARIYRSVADSLDALLDQLNEATTYNPANR